jgi:hypothetical protein
MAKSWDNRNAVSRQRCDHAESPATVIELFRNSGPKERGYNRAMTKEARNMLATWLRNALSTRNVSAAELVRRIKDAGIAGLTSDKISRVLSRERDLTYEEVATIATVLGDGRGHGDSA